MSSLLFTGILCLDIGGYHTEAYLASQREERLRQAKISFRIALTALIAGILLVFIGIILALTTNYSIGIVISFSSVVIEIVSALAFKFQGDANDRLDRLGKEAYIVEQTKLSMEYIIQITDPKARDAAIADLVRRLHATASEVQTSESMKRDKASKRNI